MQKNYDDLQNLEKMTLREKNHNILSFESNKFVLTHFFTSKNNEDIRMCKIKETPCITPCIILNSFKLIIRIICNLFITYNFKLYNFNF